MDAPVGNHHPKGPMPKSIVCYICGKPYGLTSTAIHIKACIKKWETVEGNKPKSERRKVPAHLTELDELLAKSNPTQQELDAYNDTAFNYYNKVALCPCPNCGRTFLPDSLVVHLKSCKGDGSYKKEGKKGPVCKPRGVICYICGREFGTASIEIHLKACKKKWEEVESVKPKKERRPLPQPPKEFSEVGEKGFSGMKTKELDSMNEEAFNKFNNESRVACDYCGRKFLPDRLEVHLRSCAKSGSPPIKKSPQGSPPEEKKSSTIASPGPKMISRPKALVCYICGREFGTTSLDIHLKACKKKWEEAESLKPEKERKPVPEPPKALEDVTVKGSSAGQYNIEKYNEEAFKDFKDKALDPCPNCGRKFLPDRLVVHLRSCKVPKNPEEEKKVDLPKDIMPSSKALLINKPPAKEERKKKVYPSLAEMLKTGKMEKKKKPEDVEIKTSAKKSKGDTISPNKKVNTEVNVLKKNSPGPPGKSEYVEIERKQCPGCGRNFAVDRFDMHTNVCKGTSKGSGSKANMGGPGPMGGGKPGFKATYD